MLTLYFSPGASSMAPHIALHEVGAPFEGKPVSLAKKETHTPEFLAINPEGKVPTMLIDGRVLTEVAGILFYLAKRFPIAGLLPDGDIEAEGRVVSWMSFIASSIHPARRQGLEHARAIYRARRIPQHRSPLHAHDGAAGGEEDHRGRVEDRLRAAGLSACNWRTVRR